MIANVKKRIKIWQIILLIETIALIIAIAITIGPSKTGSDWSFAELFFVEPTLVQKIYIAFIFTNLLLGFFVLIGHYFLRKDKKKNLNEK